MIHIDLFSGIGGFAYAACQVWPDYRNLFFCDNNTFCQAVLRKNFGADSLIYGDIREVTVERVIKDTIGSGCTYGKLDKETAEVRGQWFSGAGDGNGVRDGAVIADTERCGTEKGDYEIQREGQGNNFNGERFRNEPAGNSGISVDLPTGGFPCQPFSAAGKRKGTRDDRFLWPEMLRIIREFKPTWIIGENVAGLLSMAESVGESTMGSQTDLFGNRTDTKINRGRGILYRIIGELEQIGYAVQVFCIPACAVNAPHRRDRIWIVAKSASNGLNTSEPRELRENTEAAQTGAGNAAQNVGHRILDRGQADRHAADAESRGCGYGVAEDIRQSSKQVNALGDTDGLSIGWEQNWLEVATRLCGISNGFPAELDGFKLSASKHREERLKALGNAIVPQVAIEIMRAIKCTDELEFGGEQNDH